MADDVESPHGTKRKALELEQDKNRIKALDADVVAKIAAGEIIVSPQQCLKELLENAIDAGSSSLEVVVKEGGLKSLQISDNGCGIEHGDLGILCERFTTSKIAKFEDLQSIETFGFRGEALASISHISHLTVTTKTKDSDLAWKAYYGDGKLAPPKPGQTADPKPVAGRQGTTILIEDLFYNVPSRKNAFRSASDEYNKIIDMVGRYSIHCSGVAFSCKKHGDSSTSVAIQANASIADRIRNIYGGSVANELMKFSTADARCGFTASGLATNANYSVKRTTLLLFINNRCVESTNVKKALEQTYAAFLPKSGKPFIYLSLDIDPKRVDVNVHPTKREVHFLHEDEIIQAVCEHLRCKLAEVDTSRTFMTQTLLPGAAWSTALHDSGVDSTKKPMKADGSSNTRRTPARPENTLVRTDTNARKITSMLKRTAESEMPEYDTRSCDAVPCRLGSIRELKAAVRDDIHHELTEILANHSWVGIVDEQRRLAAIQGGIKLYLVDYGRLCFEYFYQVGLTNFGNFGTIEFSPALDLRELLTQAAERKKAMATNGEPAADGDRNEHDVTHVDQDEDQEIADMVEQTAEQLMERRAMLLEYFSLEITPAGDLVSIPLLVKGYTPAIFKLPQFLLRLGSNVDWNKEKACFDGFLRELATFYVPEQLPPSAGDGDEDHGPTASQTQTQRAEGKGEGEHVVPERDKGKEKEGEGHDELEERRKHVRWAVEHVLFPAFKARLVATKLLMERGILEMANLRGLYRVFERC